MSTDEMPVSENRTPLEDAVLAMERIEWHRKNLDHHLRLSEQRAQEIRDRIAQNEALLKECAHALKREYGHAETLLPNGGRVRISKARGTFVILDDRAAEAEARALGCVRARTVESVDKTALRKALREAEDGTLADPRTGEVVGWAKIERPPDRCSLSYELPDRRPQPNMESVLRAAIADGQGEGRAVTHLAPETTWRVVAVTADSDTWAQVIAGSESYATIAYRDTIAHWSEAGGVRLLDADGRCVRYFGQKAKP